jgi:DNA-binding winged helix-turn-helix (wHTH) protein/tetratricopeptide (TPR) repeat protein
LDREYIEYHFPPFAFSTETNDLRRNGYTIKLPTQAAAVLAEFLEHPGKLVTRTDISHILWPKGGDTESDQGINNIIRILRVALRDTGPGAPSFIETIPKKGYRFLVPVSSVAPNIKLRGGPQPPTSNGTAGANVEGPFADALPSPLTGIPLPKFRLYAFEKRVIAVIVFLMIGLGWIGWRVRHRSALPTLAHQPILVVVAPFEVNGSSASDDQLAETFRLDLIDMLSQLPGIGVRGGYPASGKNLNAFGPAELHNLDATAVLYTTLTKKGEFCTLQTELVRTSDATHLHSWHYSGTAANLGSLREQMQVDIFDFLKGSGRTRENVGGTADSAAYELYLKARYHARQRDPQSVMMASQEYKEAIARDPHFAKAFSGLGMVAFLQAQNDTDYGMAEEPSMKAIKLAPDLAEAHAVLGLIYFRHEWRFAAGEEEMKRAITLDPYDPSLHLWMSFMLASLGSFEESSREVELAKREDPSWVPVYRCEAYVAFLSSDKGRINRALQKVLELEPDDPSSHELIAENYWNNGQYLQAIATWRKVAEMRKESDRIALEDRGLLAFKAAGVRAYAQVKLEAALAHGKHDEAMDSSIVPAEWAAHAGNYQLCLEALSKMVDNRDARLIDIAFNPTYQRLHGDKRFQALLLRIGLPVPRDSVLTVAQHNKESSD